MLCSVITGFAEIVRHGRKDLRVPALSEAFAAISVLALSIILITITMAFDAWPATAP